MLPRLAIRLIAVMGLDKSGCELQVYDVSNPATPTYVNGVDAMGTINAGTSLAFNDLDVNGNLLYVGGSGNSTNCNTVGNKSGCELQVYDITNPEEPTFMGGADAGGDAQ